MKKIVFVILLLSLIGIGGVVFSKSEKKQPNTSELSQRSKEYLAKQKSKGNLEFGGIESENKSRDKVSSQSIKVGNCFSITIPFPITSNKNLGECFDQISVSPRGIINVYTRDASFQSLDEDPGVKLRRDDRKTYTEGKKTVNGKDYLIFKRKEGEYEKTALYLYSGKLFSLNLLSSFGDSSLDAKFNQMLESVEFL